MSAQIAHTPEPWIFEAPDSEHEGIIIGRHGGAVVDGDFTEANARRIVAAVNACAGIPTETLECPGGNIAKVAGSLLKQRNKLLAALENIIAITNDSQGVAGYHLNGDIAYWDSFQEIAEAEAAIAEAKGESK